ncbi:MAG: deoxyribose-phosphate aldolase [Clostridiales bacterium]|nr:deoxyribose-phosphate aldolase [Clostridiales bacterium]
MLKKSEVLAHIDHTLLSQTADLAQIKAICDEAVRFGAASVCIPPAYVKEAAQYLKGAVPVCTVIGFPNGYNTTEIKCAETKQAIDEGAEEIDMVINVAFLKDGRYDYVEDEIRRVKEVCGEKILKVIVETCYLTEEEKVFMCEAVASAGAEYIKTSTGFGTGNATFEDVALFSRCLDGTNVKIKASGGIKTFEDAAKFLELGADRLGSSSLIKSLL